MTIFMRKQMKEQEILHIAASSHHGAGEFYVTDRAVAYEVNGRGIYLNFIPRTMIQKFTASGSTLFGTRKFRLTWMENDTVHSFEFRTKHHAKLQTILDKYFQ